MFKTILIILLAIIIMGMVFKILFKLGFILLVLILGVYLLYNLTKSHRVSAEHRAGTQEGV